MLKVFYYVLMLSAVANVVVNGRTLLPAAEQNVEALADGEGKIYITCLPEDESICVSLIEDIVVIDAYFSPH